MLLLVWNEYENPKRVRTRQNNSFNTRNTFPEHFSFMKSSDVSSYKYSQKKKPVDILYKSGTSNLKWTRRFKYDLKKQ